MTDPTESTRPVDDDAVLERTFWVAPVVKTIVAGEAEASTRVRPDTAFATS